MLAYRTLRLLAITLRWMAWQFSDLSGSLDDAADRTADLAKDMAGASMQRSELRALDRVYEAHGKLADAEEELAQAEDNLSDLRYNNDDRLAVINREVI